MKYVCDLWYETNGCVTPYGEFFFENDKDRYPEPFEVGRKITEELSFLQEDFIEEKGLCRATPGGRETKRGSHYCCVKFTVNGKTNYVYFTGLRPVLEDKKPDEMNLYT